MCQQLLDKTPFDDLAWESLLDLELATRSLSIVEGRSQIRQDNRRAITKALIRKAQSSVQLTILHQLFGQGFISK